MHIILVALVMIVAWATPAAAQDSRVLVGVNFGVTNPIGDLSDDVARDTSIAGHIAIRLAGSLAVRGEIGRNRFAPPDEIQTLCDDLNITCPTARVTNYNVGIQYGGFGDQNRGALGLSKVRVMPYGFATIGRYTTSEEDSSNGQPFDESDTFLGFNVGAGLNIRITDNFGLAGDVRLHGVRGDENQTDVRKWDYFAVPSVGVWVLF